MLIKKRFSRSILLFWMLLALPGFFAFSLQTEWYVSGTGAAIEGNDSNDGTRERPLASVQRALSQIRVAHAKEQFDSAAIVIDGSVSNFGPDAEIFGMVTIRGNEYPAITLKGVEPNACLDAGGVRGVLYIESTKQVTLERIVISGGWASTGAGVYVQDSDLVVGEGAVIQNNSGGFGGGICVEGGTCVVTGNVSGNKAENGGGIALRGKTVFSLSGTIRDNFATSSGGGVLLDGGTGEIREGIVQGNTAENGTGGGVLVNGNGAVLVIHSGLISGNHAPKSGGGGLAVINNASVQIEICSIQDNDARLGGAVYLYNAVCDLSDAKITSNEAVQGGGILLYSSDFSMSGGIIFGNHSTDVGGAIAIGGAITIGENTQRLSSFKMTGGVIEGNKADG